LQKIAAMDDASKAAAEFLILEVTLP
jgi:hypothetical protein